MKNHTIASAGSTFRAYNLRLPTTRRQRKLVFSSLRLPIRARHNTGLGISREAKNSRKANAFPIHPGVWAILLSLSIGVDVDVDISEPFWSRSFSSSTPLLQPIPDNATCKDPGHRTMIMIIVIYNCILCNVNDYSASYLLHGSLNSVRA